MLSRTATLWEGTVLACGLRLGVAPVHTSVHISGREGGEGGGPAELPVPVVRTLTEAIRIGKGVKVRAFVPRLRLWREQRIAEARATGC